MPKLTRMLDKCQTMNQELDLYKHNAEQQSDSLSNKQTGCIRICHERNRQMNRYLVDI